MSDDMFIDRRGRKNRRVDPDPCQELPVDLYHRKRRKSAERRHTNRSLEDDYNAVVEKTGVDSKGKQTH